MSTAIGATPPQASQKQESARAAAEYHLNAGGQRVRTKIALQAGLAAGLSSQDAIIIAATVELLHSASLVHDDIQDHDEMRRGQPAVWCRFGVNTAICTGDLLLSAAYATLCKFSDSGALAQMIVLMHARVGMAVDGQCDDLKTDNETVVDSVTAVAQYQQIAKAKSGALLSLPLELVLIASGHEEHLTNAGRAAAAFAIGYQIVDDLQDLSADVGNKSLRSTYNIVAVFNASYSFDESIEKARALALEQIDLAISLATHLPYNIGERLGDYACQLRHVVDGHNLEA